MDEVKPGGMLEGFGDVKVLGDFGIDGAILFIAAGDYGMQAGAGDGIPGGEERDIPAAADQAFGDVAGDGLPCAVLAGRCPPGDRREDCHSFVRNGQAGSMAAKTSETGTVAKPVA